MLRDVIAPSLREIGFKGSGTKYKMERNDYEIEIDFQSSKFSTRDAVQFDLNLAIRHPPTLELFKRANDQAREMGKEFESPTSGGYWNRLSRLATRPAFNWQVTSQDPIEPVGEDVVSCVRELFMPVIDEEIHRPLVTPTPPNQRPDRPSHDERNEAALDWHLEALRAVGIRNVRRIDLEDLPRHAPPR
jgi:Domain of unknown function (DUF4304)